MKLSKQLIMLGDQHPDLKPYLEIIIDRVLEMEESFVEVTEKPEAAGESLLTISPAAHRAFNTVLVPQLELRVPNASLADLNQILSEVADLGRGTNPKLEESLILMKPISSSNATFFSEIQEIFELWIRPRLTSKEA